MRLADGGALASEQFDNTSCLGRRASGVASLRTRETKFTVHDASSLFVGEANIKLMRCKSNLLCSRCGN